MTLAAPMYYPSGRERGVPDASLHPTTIVELLELI
jgi:hypothetical protein